MRFGGVATAGALLALLSGGVTGCSQEDPVTASEVDVLLADHAVVSGHELHCHDLELWQRACRLDITITSAAASTVAPLLADLGPLADERVQVSLLLGGTRRAEIELSKGADTEALAAVFERLAAVPDATSILVRAGGVVATVEVSLQERIRLAAELVAMVGDVRIVLGQGRVHVVGPGDVTDEVALATAVLDDWRVEGVEQVDIADGRLLMRVEDPAAEPIALEVARAHQAYGKVAIVDIGFDAGLDKPQPQRVVRAAAEPLEGVFAFIDEGQLRLRVADAATAVAVHRQLLAAVPTEYAASSLVWEWSAATHDVELTRLAGSDLDLVPVMTAADAAPWVNVELRPLADHRHLLFVELAADAEAHTSAEQAGRALRAAGLKDPLLRATAYGGVLAGGLDLDVVDGDLVVTDHAGPVDAEVIAAFRRGWDSGATG